MKFVEREYVFDLNSSPGFEGSSMDTAFYLDLMQIHSLVNRVSCRQGRLVGVQSIEIGCKAGGSFSAAIWRLGHQWSVVNAWEKSMRLWLEQQNDTAEEAGLESTIARYRDYKVHMTAMHANQGFTSNALPVGYSIDDLATTSDRYAWDASHLVIPNDAVVGTTTERQIYVVGEDDTTLVPDGISLVHAYADSRRRPTVTDPNIVTAADGGIFAEMFDVGMDDNEIIENFQGENHHAPYLNYHLSVEEGYPGGEFQGNQSAVGFTGPDSVNLGTGPQAMHLHDILSVNASQNYNTDVASPLLVPLGLLCIQIVASNVGVGAGPLPNPPPNGDINAGIWMKVVLAPGDYQGVYAIDMTDVN